MPDEVARVAEIVAAIRAPLASVLYGQEALIDGLITAVFAGGHVLLQGPPGVGKTLAARGLAALLGGGFARIQCVPDLLPADITGATVFLRETGRFEVRRGPLFAGVVLADELNRTTPRTQSALLEAMAEGQVTIDGQSLALPHPHLVIATQNPLDAEGTYPLPLNELDRFLFLLRVGYPPPEQERSLLLASGPVGLEALSGLQPAVSRDVQLAALQAVREGVSVSEAIADYVMRLVAATRTHPDLDVGISPRGALMLLRAAQAQAATDGRPFVTPDDVRDVWLPVCRHRIRATPEVEVEAFDPDALLRGIAEETEVPR